MAGLISLEEEQMLAEKVKKFPVLYDKLVEGYNEKDVASVVWEEVAQELDFTENGAKAQSLYITLKKKYQRKKRDLAEATKSGIPKAISRAERSLRPYEFMTWLDTYFVTRQKRKLDYSPRDQDGVGVFGDYEYSMVIPKASPVHDKSESHTDTRRSSHFQVGASSYVSNESASETETTAAHPDLSVRDALIQPNFLSPRPRKRKLDEEDKEDLFCKSLAADLRDLPQYERCLARNEITNVIFKYQMKVLTLRRDHTTNQGNR